MIIDDFTYNLPLNNYLNVETTKKQIIFGNTFNTGMKHFAGWLHRYNGKFKKTAAFTIAKNGTIYQHFNPKYYSNYFKNKEINQKAIIVLLENEGWLIKDDKKNVFITWIGDIYKEPDNVVEKKWRGYTYWSPYTKEQFTSVISLVRIICKDFSIPKKSIGHNTKIDNFKNEEGILYKSNLEKNYTDLSPAFDFEIFKNNL